MTTAYSISRCAEAVSQIDRYLIKNQKSGSYAHWIERYKEDPIEHDDAFLFGKLVQAMVSGGMKGEVVDNWMPRMQKSLSQLPLLFHFMFNKVEQSFS